MGSGTGGRCVANLSSFHGKLWEFLLLRSIDKSLKVKFNEEYTVIFNWIITGKNPYLELCFFISFQLTSLFQFSEREANITYLKVDSTILN